ncbi:hypothetical protein KAR04_02160, partial [Candidatus Calescamantes bacterium]|nr:hypothetical protein [Candidatus Calescamantes bacterium]
MIMAPLFTEDQKVSLKRSGKLITQKKNEFIEMKEDDTVLDPKLQEKLWKISLDLCNDEETVQIAKRYLEI